jgi:catechol 2,3-dioxygenase-like lactoylglutathione lyase family enzyme
VQSLGRLAPRTDDCQGCDQDDRAHVSALRREHSGLSLRTKDLPAPAAGPSRTPRGGPSGPSRPITAADPHWPGPPGPGAGDGCYPGRAQRIVGRGPGSEVWLLEQPDIGRSRLGAGGTHHVAFRVKDFETQKMWHTHLSQGGLHVSNLIDRFWFRSIYFRVSNGILFEIATDGPGFAIDEAPDNLGEKLVLPPFLEGRRPEIEAELTPIGA